MRHSVVQRRPTQWSTACRRLQAGLSGHCLLCSLTALQRPTAHRKDVDQFGERGAVQGSAHLRGAEISGEHHCTVGEDVDGRRN